VHIEIKKIKSNSKEEEKVAMQSNLAGFFGLKTHPQSKF
jgi:exodeoxyribonuclease III